MLVHEVVGLVQELGGIKHRVGRAQALDGNHYVLLRRTLNGEWRCRPHVSSVLLEQELGVLEQLLRLCGRQAFENFQQAFLSLVHGVRRRGAMVATSAVAPSAALPPRQLLPALLSAAVPDAALPPSSLKSYLLHPWSRPSLESSSASK